MEEPIKKRMEEKKIQEIILVEEDVEPLDAFTFEADKPESGGPVPNINCYVTLDLIVLCVLCVMLAWKVEKGLGRRFKRGSVPIIGSLFLKHLSSPRNFFFILFNPTCTDFMKP